MSLIERLTGETLPQQISTEKEVEVLTQLLHESRSENERLERALRVSTRSQRVAQDRLSEAFEQLKDRGEELHRLEWQLKDSKAEIKSLCQENDNLREKVIQPLLSLLGETEDSGLRGMLNHQQKEMVSDVLKRVLRHGLLEPTPTPTQKPIHALDLMDLLGGLLPPAENAGDGGTVAK